MKTKFTSLLGTFLLLSGLYAQQTGSFNANITFMGQSRTLSCYVPADYDTSVDYRLMIGLHGLGDNGANYRNVLINSGNWPSVFPNTIFIFPDGGNDQNSDFHAPAGDEFIIDSAIAFAADQYSIDSSNIILQGFSLGGRSALAHGLNYPDVFKGLLLNTPAIQGLQDAKNTPGAGVIYNYGNAPQIPIYITVGSQDILYVHTVNEGLKELQKENAKVRYVEFSGAHTIPGGGITGAAIPFFEDPVSGPYDLDIFDIVTKDQYCSADVDVEFYVQNKGSNTLTSFDVDYELGSQSGTYTWTGSLAPHQHALVALPVITTSGIEGTHDINLEISMLNGSEADTITKNNQHSKEVVIHAEKDTLAVTMGFEDDDVNRDKWAFPVTGSLFYWYFDSEVKRSGNNSVANFNTIFIFNTLGNVERFLSPVMDMTDEATPYLSFDLAFNYHHFTPPFLLVDTIFTDTLEIAISTDCGNTFETIYRKSGAELATADSAILNPLSVDQGFFFPDSSEWRKEVLDLQDYAGEGEVIVQFSYISGLGGSIYIDNINISGEGVSLKEERAVADFSLFPNPANDYISIDAEYDGEGEVTIYDALGKPVVYQNINLERNSGKKISIAHLPTGIYQVEVITGEKRGVRKLLIAD